ncbi:MAG: hypothetical protein L6406_14455 [Desulfobacterales bacterium]|nr:hypothetical protein [Desulfobacterales bacterium]
MPSDYDSIRADNIREYGEGTRHLSFLGRLYTDRTHFIFELLQNAEDAGAAKILFELFEDRLEVKHDGRPFNELDVRGVCGVGEGTKAEDLTQIGTFGIGFKSVYAYTSAPEVHSGMEHFRIEHYVRPYKAATKAPSDSWTTLFVFAFDAPGLEPQIAMHEIAERLRNLSARTLLFLRKIEEIEYKLLDNQGGFYLRGKPVPRDKTRQVNVIGQNNGQNEDENWLVFDRPLSVPDPNKPDHVKTVWVEIGFKLETNAKDQTESIVRIKESPLIVYFPTEKLTRFGFLIQGPYRTTPSRDNIPKDDDWNAKLVEETALLLVDALQRLKEMGLLTVALLNALPIRMNVFPEDGMFYPIVEAVHDALMDQELFPADEGTFVSARNAKLARGAELRKLLTHDQLRELFQSKDDIKWLSGEITQDRTPDLRSYLMSELDVEEIRPEGFAQLITDYFLEAQTDDWIIQFYNFLGKDKSDLWKKPDSILRKKKILRLEDNSHVIPFQPDGNPNAFLPSSSKTKFPTIKRKIFNDKGAEEFLRNLRLFEPDLFAEVITFVLPKYIDHPSLVDFQDNIEDFKKINKLINTPFGKEAKNSIAKLRILLPKLGFESLVDKLDENSEELILPLLKMVLPQFKLFHAVNKGRERYKSAKDIYLNNADLHMYFENNPTAWFVDKSYPEDLEQLFKDLSIGDIPRAKRKHKGDKGYVIIQSSHGWHTRGLNGFDLGIEVDGLEYALKHPTVEKSSFIWNRIAIANSDCIHGIVESSSRKTFENSKREKQTSQKFGRLLIDTPWLPDRQGTFHKPCELELGDLPDSFIPDEKLADQLGMKKDVVAKLAEEAGISQDTIDLARSLERCPADIRKKIESLLQEQDRKQPEFPQRRSADPERRQERLAEQMNEATEKEYEQRNRSVRTTKGTVDEKQWLKEQYTNSAGQMICQICKEEMPFKKRDGEYYFEAVEALSRDHFTKEHEAQFLALCPLCAAMYNEFVKHDEGAMESLKNALMNSEDSEDAEVSLQLGELDTSIRFVKSHFMDIKTIIEVQG